MQKVVTVSSSNEGSLDLPMEVFLSDTRGALLPSPWAPVSL